MFIIVLGQHVSIIIESSSGPSKIQILIIIVLGQHVSILIESSSGPSKKIDPYLEMLKCAVGPQTLTFLI